jgi:hypothetical protein
VRGIERVWLEIRCVRSVEEGEVEGKEEMRVVK